MAQVKIPHLKQVSSNPLSWECTACSKQFTNPPHTEKSITSAFGEHVRKDRARKDFSQAAARIVKQAEHR
jgi:hypothetical protein